MWRELPGASAEVVPNVHPGRRMHSRPESVVGLAGYYQADGACPIGEAATRARPADRSKLKRIVRLCFRGRVGELSGDARALDRETGLVRSDLSGLPE
jgi:hypothetical protein